MSKLRRKTDDQLTIFDHLQSLAESNVTSNEGQFKIIDRLRSAIRAAIKNCLLSRYQIAGEMSNLLGETITKEMLDSWTRESDEINGRPGRHVPAEYLPAFCQTTGCNDPIVILGRMAGVFVLPGPEALRAEIRKLDERILEAKASRRRRIMFLKEIEKEL